MSKRTKNENLDKNHKKNPIVMVRDGYYINDKVFKLIKMKIKNEFQK